MTARDALVDACVPLAAELVGSACAGVTEPLWDATVDGEDEIQRVRRQAAGLRFCGRCPVRSACLAAVDLRHDDGLRGGALLPTIHDSDRRSWLTWQPGRSGLGDVVDRETCSTRRETSSPATLVRRATGPTTKQVRSPAAPATSRTRSA